MEKASLMGKYPKKVLLVVTKMEIYEKDKKTFVNGKV